MALVALCNKERHSSKGTPMSIHANTVLLESPSNPKRPLKFAIGLKGGISVYGVGRFPVTLYKSQWEQIVMNLPEMMAFINANAHLCATKA